MTVTLSGPLLEAQIAPLGAELISLKDEAGRDLLWDGDPAFWTGRSPLLFPIVGRVREDRIRVDGREYPLKQHGFARHLEFDPVDVGRESCTFRIESSDATREQYPYSFQLDVTYRVHGATLIVTSSLLNAGDRFMPVSFGYHPALRWPLPYGGDREDHEIRFDAPERFPIRRPTPDGLLKLDTEPSPLGEGARLPLRDSLFDKGALVFDRLTSRSVRYGVPGHRGITVSFPGMPQLGIWTKPGAGYVCIEPWNGYASPENFDGEFADKPGITILAPQATQSFEMKIILSPPKG